MAETKFGSGASVPFIKKRCHFSLEVLEQSHKFENLQEIKLAACYCYEVFQYRKFTTKNGLPFLPILPGSPFVGFSPGPTGPTEPALPCGPGSPAGAAIPGVPGGPVSPGSPLGPDLSVHSEESCCPNVNSSKSR